MSEDSGILNDAIAFRLIGEFLYHFSYLESEIDKGIAKILSIESGYMEIIASNVDFSRKVNIIRSAEVHQSELPNDERRKILNNTFNNILRLNDQRKIVAHCRFSALPDGVRFHRSIAAKTLKVEDIEWSVSNFEKTYAEIKDVAERIRFIVSTIVPYVPKLDFSDPRNSAYISLF